LIDTCLKRGFRNLPLLPCFKQASVSEKPLKESSFDCRTDGPWPLRINFGGFRGREYGEHMKCGLVGTYVHRFIGLKLGCRGSRRRRHRYGSKRRRQPDRREDREAPIQPLQRGFSAHLPARSCVLHLRSDHLWSFRRRIIAYRMKL
jgi:hypothetical protein